MKRMLPALALAAFAAAPALATDSTATRKAMTLDEAVVYLQSIFPGEVVAARYDHSPAERGHYHVDMRFAHGGVAKLEVDALTRELASVPPAVGKLPAMTLAQAMASVGRVIPGKVTFAEFDASDSRDPHFHVDLMLDNGEIVALRVEPNGDLLWRDTIAKND